MGNPQHYKPGSNAIPSIYFNLKAADKKIKIIRGTTGYNFGLRCQIDYLQIVLFYGMKIKTPE